MITFHEAAQVLHATIYIDGVSMQSIVPTVFIQHDMKLSSMPLPWSIQASPKIHWSKQIFQGWHPVEDSVAMNGVLSFFDSAMSDFSVT
jgi:hypothetical protein